MLRSVSWRILRRDPGIAQHPNEIWRKRILRLNLFSILIFTFLKVSGAFRLQTEDTFLRINKVQLVEQAEDVVG